jgi:hypothetical protein
VRHSQPDNPSEASLRRLALRLPASEFAETDPVCFDADRFAATLKRAHVEAVTLMASAATDMRTDNASRFAQELSDSDFGSRLATACRGQGLAVESAAIPAEDSGTSLAAFASRPALEAACYQQLCGGRSLVLEDRIHLAQPIDTERYGWLSAVFGEIAFKERWCRGAHRLVEIGVLSPATPSESGSGAARLLQAGGHAFDLLAASADFTHYRLLVVPEDIVLDSDLNARLQAYLQQGGKLLAAFESDVERAKAGFAAASREAEPEAVTLQDGNALVFARSHFRSYAQSAGAREKRLVLEALKLLLPDPLLRHDGPGTLEATVTEQAEQNRWVLHLTHYLPLGLALDSGIRDDLLPVHEVKISLRTPKPVTRVALRPQYHDELDFWEYQGRVEFVVPKIVGHRLVSIEFAEEQAR